MPSDFVLVLLSGVFGLIGTVTGGVIAMKTQEQAEKRRDAAEMNAFLNLMRSDLMRWSGAMLEAADFSMTLRLGTGLTWIQVAASGSRFLPDDLFALLFHVYSDRDRTEHAYGQLRGAGFRQARLVTPLVFN